MATNPTATLIIENGLPDHAPIVLDRPVSVFGKSSSVDVFLDNLYVSRRHFQISRKDDVFFITDLDSTNGTHVNSTKLGPHECWQPAKMGHFC